jgi:hypothetical protein
LGPVQQCRHQIESALHAAREGLHRVAPAVRELHRREHLVDPRAKIRAVQAMELPENTQVLLRAQILVERDGLRHEPERTPRGRIRSRNRLPGKRDATRVGRT